MGTSLSVAVVEFYATKIVNCVYRSAIERSKTPILHITGCTDWRFVRNVLASIRGFIDLCHVLVIICLRQEHTHTLSGKRWPRYAMQTLGRKRGRRKLIAKSADKKHASSSEYQRWVGERRELAWDRDAKIAAHTPYVVTSLRKPLNVRR